MRTPQHEQAGWPGGTGGREARAAGTPTGHCAHFPELGDPACWAELVFLLVRLWFVFGL